MDKDTQDIIDRYARGELDYDERTAFEKKMRDDARLREEVELTVLITEGFKRVGDEAAVDEMKSLDESEIKNILRNAERKYEQKHEERFAAKPAAKRKRLVQLWAAAIAAAACVIAYAAFQPEYSSDKLFKEYFVAAEYIPARGGHEIEEGREAGINTAFNLYLQADYAGAAGAFDKALAGMNVKDVPDEILLYYSVCLIETGKPKEAVKNLKCVTDNAESEFCEDAEWYLALSYLKTDSRSDALSVLQKMADSKSSYAEKATELIRKTKRKKIS